MVSGIIKAMIIKKALAFIDKVDEKQFKEYLEKANSFIKKEIEGTDFIKIKKQLMDFVENSADKVQEHINNPTKLFEEFFKGFESKETPNDEELEKEKIKHANNEIFSDLVNTLHGIDPKAALAISDMRVKDRLFNFDTIYKVTKPDTDEVSLSGVLVYLIGDFSRTELGSFYWKSVLKEMGEV